MFEFFKKQKKEVLPQPKTLLQEVLYGLITKTEVSFFDFTMQDFRKRICILKDEGLNIQKRTCVRHSKYGNKFYYGVHFLYFEEHEKAIALYKKMQKE